MKKKIVYFDAMFVCLKSLPIHKLQTNKTQSLCLGQPVSKTISFSESFRFIG